MYGGKNTIIVLPQFQIDGMVEVMDVILSHPYRYTAGQIKENFNLNEEEYQMIYDFCMPHERHRSNERFWISKYKGLLGAITGLITSMKVNYHKTTSIESLEEIVKKHSIGKQNLDCHEAYEKVDEDEDYEEEEEDVDEV